MQPKHQNPFHPGEILQELYLEPLGLSQGIVAKHLGCTRAALNEIINGRRGISPKMACRLADAFNTTPELWLNLQRDYDLWQVRKTHKKLSAIAS
jgi:addiction module HigA family antidote